MKGRSAASVMSGSEYKHYKGYKDLPSTTGAAFMARHFSKTDIGNNHFYLFMVTRVTQSMYDSRITCEKVPALPIPGKPAPDKRGYLITTGYHKYDDVVPAFRFYFLSEIHHGLPYCNYIRQVTLHESSIVYIDPDRHSFYTNECTIGGEINIGDFDLFLPGTRFEDFVKTGENNIFNVPAQFLTPDLIVNHAFKTYPNLINDEKFQGYLKQEHYDLIFEFTTEPIKKMPKEYITRNIALKAVKKSGQDLKYIPKHFHADKEILYAAVYNTYYTFDLEELDRSLITLELLKDKEIVKQFSNWADRVSKDLFDLELCISAELEDQYAILRIPAKFHTYEFFMATVAKHPYLLSFVPIDVMCEDIIIESLTHSIDGLKLITNFEYKTNRNIAQAAFVHSIESVKLFYSDAKYNLYDLEQYQLIKDYNKEPGRESLIMYIPEEIYKTLC